MQSVRYEYYSYELWLKAGCLDGDVCAVVDDGMVSLLLCDRNDDAAFAVFAAAVVAVMGQGWFSDWIDPSPI